MGDRNDHLFRVPFKDRLDHLDEMDKQENRLRLEKLAAEAQAYHADAYRQMPADLRQQAETWGVKALMEAVWLNGWDCGYRQSVRDRADRDGSPSPQPNLSGPHAGPPKRAVHSLSKTSGAKEMHVTPSIYNSRLVSDCVSPSREDFPTGHGYAWDDFHGSDAKGNLVVDPSPERLVNENAERSDDETAARNHLADHDPGSTNRNIQPTQSTTAEEQAGIAILGSTRDDRTEYEQKQNRPAQAKPRRQQEKIAQADLLAHVPPKYFVTLFNQVSHALALSPYLAQDRIRPCLLLRQRSLQRPGLTNLLGKTFLNIFQPAVHRLVPSSSSEQHSMPIVANQPRDVPSRFPKIFGQFANHRKIGEPLSTLASPGPQLKANGGDGP